MPYVSKCHQHHKQHTEKYRDPARRPGILVVIGFLCTRNVWRNTHSPSSINKDHAGVGLLTHELSTAFAHKSILSRINGICLDDYSWSLPRPLAPATLQKRRCAIPRAA